MSRMDITTLLTVLITLCLVFVECNCTEISSFLQRLKKTASQNGINGGLNPYSEYAFNSACLPTEFSCSDFSKCIPHRWMCDYNIDCPDGSDERYCICGYDDFTCLSGGCAPSMWKCDGWLDCFDGSDEHDCLTCAERLLMASEELCNYVWDCDDGSDELEANCSPMSSLTSTVVTVTSPNYPLNYANHESVIWTFVAEHGETLKFICLDVSMETNHDYLLIGGGVDPTKNQLAVIGGKVCENVTTTGNTMWIHFVTDYSVTDVGFKGTVEIISVLCEDGSAILKVDDICDYEWDCDDGSDEIGCPPLTNKENAITIKSPNFPSKYSSNSHVIWTFSTEEEETLTFRCIQFETEANFDTLKIGEGNDTSNADSVRAVFTGQHCHNVSTTGNTMWISFDSDSSINSFGFEGTISVTPEKLDLCGYSGQIVDSRIIGGQDTTIKRWPWQGMLIKLLPDGSQLQHCGGTLITTKHVLTAAHCFTAVSSDSNPSLWRVGLGKTHLANVHDDGQLYRNVTKISLHPQFNLVTYDCDIAIIELDSPVTIPQTRDDLELGPSVNIACLDDGKYEWESSSKCVITGYGVLNESSNSLSDTLQEADVSYMDNISCQTNTEYNERRLITENMLCAQSEDNSRDTCRGDSGGPLVCRGDRLNYVLTGITSWGYRCAQEGYPGVYTKVAKFHVWIMNQIGSKIN